jgi:HNH endonuclease
MADAEDHCSDCGKPRIECFRQKFTRGRCSNCYKRHVYALKKAGAFEAIKPAPPLERLFSRGVAGRKGCIIWTGVVNPVSGYGQFQIGPGRDGYAHRAAYELMKGEIPEGLVIDHACHNRDTECPGGICIHRRCFNPHHLDAVTHRENRIRSPHTKTSTKSWMTHCKHGHEFTPENTRLVRRTGARVCITCHRRRQNEYTARQRAAAQQAA